MQSTFSGKNKITEDGDLKTVLGRTYQWWQAIGEYMPVVNLLQVVV